MEGRKVKGTGEIVAEVERLRARGWTMGLLSSKTWVRADRRSNSQLS